MPTRYHTVTLPDGTTETRESDTRTYTHAVVVETTEAYKADRIKSAEAKIAKVQKRIQELEPKTQDPADVEAYRVAVERETFLQEKIDKEITVHGSGEKKTIQTERWLTDGFGRNTIDAAHAARNKTARGALEVAQNELTNAQNELAAANVLVVGASHVSRWSMSAKGAQGGVAEAQKYSALKRIFITTDITVTDSKPRVAKAPKPAKPAPAAKPTVDGEEAATCPKCKTVVAKSKWAEVFGFRKMGDKTYRQSNCRKCRGQGKPKAKTAESAEALQSKIEDGTAIAPPHPLADLVPPLKA
jgi:hypothetical protein